MFADLAVSAIIVGMIGFRTKRERRKRLLTKVTPEHWRADHKVLFLNAMIFMSKESDTITGQPSRLSGDELITKTNDAEWRRKAIDILLDRVEEDYDLAKRLDRYLGLPTDAEVDEHKAWWSVAGNKASLIISICALLVALLVALFK